MLGQNQDISKITKGLEVSSPLVIIHAFDQITQINNQVNEYHQGLHPLVGEEVFSVIHAMLYEAMKRIIYIQDILNS